MAIHGNPPVVDRRKASRQYLHIAIYWRAGFLHRTREVTDAEEGRFAGVSR
jgi:hypothetical protein